MTKNHLTSETKDINTDCELLFVQIILKNQKNIITVGSFYRPDWTDEKMTLLQPQPRLTHYQERKIFGLEEISTYQRSTGQQIVL